jgi:multicomponent K+:H+ antiporter subunit G
MTLDELSPWTLGIAAAFLICGGMLTLIGSLGLLRLPGFYARMHGPSMGNTLGTGSVLIASVIIASALARRPVVHEMLIALFIIGTSPITAIMLMQAAVSRTEKS